MPIPGDEKKIRLRVERQKRERYIQELLEHKSSKIMKEIYTSVSNKDIEKIKSPLDVLFAKESIEGLKG